MLEWSNWLARWAHAPEVVSSSLTSNIIYIHGGDYNSVG